MAREATDFSKNAWPGRVTVVSIAFSSATFSAMPCIFTKPPSGSTQIFHTVSWRSTQETSAGPKPMEKASTWMPRQRAAR